MKPIGSGTAPHILAVTLPGYKSEVIVRFLSDRGICLSSGSACHKGKPSHVYAALKLPKRDLDGALRISFSYDTTQQDVAALAEGLRACEGAIVPYPVLNFLPEFSRPGAPGYFYHCAGLSAGME